MIELNGSQWVMLGKLLGAHGILGGLKVKLDNPQSQSLQKGARVALQTANNWIFDEVRSWSGSGILALSNIHDRDQAAALSKSLLFIERAKLPILNEDEVYLVDLLEYAVKDIHQNELGKFVGFSSNGAQTLGHLEEGSRANPVLVPLISPFLIGIDEANKVVTLDLPDGLREAN